MMPTQIWIHLRVLVGPAVLLKIGRLASKMNARTEDGADCGRENPSPRRERRGIGPRPLDVAGEAEGGRHSNGPQLMDSAAIVIKPIAPMAIAMYKRQPGSIESDMLFSVQTPLVSRAPTLPGESRSHLCYARAVLRAPWG